MGIIGWIVIGAIAGWLASAIVGAPRTGCFWNIVIGILGAFVGGALFSRADSADRKFRFDFDLKTLAVATLGAIVLLLVVNLMTSLGKRVRR
jgi:uncharacterized membrane protein YeaQ/YmgE (transglycosylase-associated protein family)